MPLYEYRCRPCALTFELLRPMSTSSRPVTCPAGHPGAERVVSLFAAHTQGNGGLQELTSAGGGCPSCAGGSCGCGAN
jgi:putative FmdB family regulatory protein